MQSLGLNDVTPFLVNEKIIDYAVEDEISSSFDRKFLNNLSLNTPTPGGGSVSALVGSLGSALCSMVAALTHEKKEMFTRRLMMEKIGVKAQKLKDELAELVLEDSQAFNRVLRASRLPGTSKEEKVKKEKSILLANKYAIEIPNKIAKKCYQVMELSEILINMGNPNSLTDASVAAEVAFAGLRGGCMNVMINLLELDDKLYIDKKKNDVDKILKKGKILHDKLFNKSLEALNRKK